MLRLVLDPRFVTGSTLAIMGACLWCLPLQHAVAAVALYLFLNLLLNLATCFFVLEPKLARPILAGSAWTFLMVPFWLWLFLSTFPWVMKFGFWRFVNSLR